DVQRAMARLVEIIGEAASHVSDEVQNLHPELPWREMIGMRNRLNASRMETDPELLWLFVSVEIPRLAPQVAAVLHELPEQVG
ncbi:MAG: HepT-like ribonuclease domain-containing protein, partial [Sciscionella sp.]